MWPFVPSFFPWALCFERSFMLQDDQYFIFKVEEYSVTWIYRILLIHSSVDELLSVWGYCEHTALKTSVRVSVWAYVLLGLQVGVRFSGCVVAPCLPFRETVICFPKWQHCFTFLLSMHEGSNFATSLFFFSTSLLTLIVHLFYDSHPGWYKVVSRCSFNLHFHSD